MFGIIFSALRGVVEIYINGEKRFDENCGMSGDVKLKLDGSLNGKVTISVLIKCTSETYGAGIGRPVVGYI